MAAPLHLATLADAASAESVGAKVRRLQGEAKALARDHVRSLIVSMAGTEALAREIAEGGACYAPGPQELARRVADGLASQMATLQQIVERG